MQMIAGNGPSPCAGRARFSIRCWLSGLAYSILFSTTASCATAAAGNNSIKRANKDRGFLIARTAPLLRTSIPGAPGVLYCVDILPQRRFDVGLADQRK